MRHFPNLVNVIIEGEPTMDSSWVKKPKSILWYRFARLALKLGFRSRNIELMGLYRQVAEVRKGLQIEADIPPDKTPSLITEDEELDVRKRFGYHFKNPQITVTLEIFLR